MGEFLLRSHPILPGERVTRRHWRVLLAQQMQIRDTLQAEGVITPNTDGEIIRLAILERFKQMHGIGDREAE